MTDTEPPSPPKPQRGKRGSRGEQGVQGLQGIKGVMGDVVVSDAIPRYAIKFIKFMLPAYLILVSFVAGAILVMKSEIGERIDNDRAQVIASDFSNCLQRNLVKESLRGVIDAALGDGKGSGSRDLTKVPGFELLEPSLQQYLRNLSTPTPATGEGASSSDTRVRLLAFRDSLVDEDCEAVKKVARIEAKHG